MTVLMFALVALLLAGTPGNRAYASCNAIAELPPIFYGDPGSIDRPFVSPDHDEKVTLRPAADSKLSLTSLTDVLITMIFKPPGVAPSTFFIAGNNNCEPFEEPVCFLERLFCHPRQTCFTGKEVGLSASGDTGIQQLEFRFPETRAAGPVTIAVTSSKQSPVDLQTETCSSVRRSERGSHLIICIDKLTMPAEDPPGDPTFAQLVAIPQSYDYQTVCTQAIGGKPKCSTKPDSDVPYTVNSAGDVAMAVNWGKILQPKSSLKFYQRNVLASTAVEAVLGRTPTPVDGNQLYIPSSVFLQTSSQQGQSFAPGPTFAPMVLLNRPKEQTVYGTADEGKSVLTFFRRKLWDHVCDGGSNKSQACEASVDCPPSSSQASPQCVPTPAAYFACDAGDRYRLPCTQAAQCPGGACRPVSEAGSVCVLLDGTWTGITCKQDSDCGSTCQQVSGTGGVGSVCAPSGPACTSNDDCGKCGPGLFEFRNRVVNGLGTLKRIATNMRGVCNSGLDEGDLCTQSSACADSVNCVTYRAEALTYTTPIPTATP